MPKKYPKDQRERAVRMVMDRLQEYPVTRRRGLPLRRWDRSWWVGAETLRKWIVQTQVDGSVRSGPTTEELAEIKRLRVENRDLREANEILRAASIFFAGELSATRRRVDRGGGSPIRGTPARVASGPDERGMRWYCQMVQVRAARPEVQRK